MILILIFYKNKNLNSKKVIIVKMKYESIDHKIYRRYI